MASSPAAAAGPSRTIGARAPLPAQAADVPWPTLTWPTASPPEGFDGAAFQEAVDRSFARIGRGGHADTRALVVVHRGAIVYERYAEGFGCTLD
jgi:hypothetical protein